MMERVVVVKSEKNEACEVVADGGGGIDGGSGGGDGLNVRMQGGNNSNWGEQPSSLTSSRVVPPDLLTLTKFGGIWRKKRMRRQRTRRSSLHFNLEVFFPIPPPPATAVVVSTSSPSSSSASHGPPPLPARVHSKKVLISFLGLFILLGKLVSLLSDTVVILAKGFNPHVTSARTTLKSDLGRLAAGLEMAPYCSERTCLRAQAKRLRFLTHSCLARLVILEIINPLTLRYLFQKQLQNSDVGPLRRMVLPKKAAESYLPALETKEGISITMDDMDGSHVWSFKYRFWPNNNSRMYVLENTGDFVNTHGLRLGDYILVYQDYINLNYVIQAKKAREQNVHTDLTTYAANNPAPRGSDTERSNQLTSWNYLQPKVEDTRMSYVYDTSFSDESLLDYLNGSMTNHYTSIRPPDSFGSVDNLSFDDFKAD
ncbi:hypothetical protein Ancab_026420 [Ancistrocladus abbreviatus]